MSPNEKKTNVIRNQHNIAAIIRIGLKFYKEICKNTNKSGNSDTSLCINDKSFHSDKETMFWNPELLYSISIS